MKLENILTITADLVCESGLHIGAGDAEMHIGGVDNAVVKHPITNQPYIPGSSLKGKMRSLLEWRSGAVKEKPLSWGDYRASGDPEVLRILQLFGTGGSDKLSAEECEKLGPSRLSFWDCAMTEDYEKLVKGAEAAFTEVKWENAINRISGVAENPRQTERVPAGAVFGFRLSVKNLSGDDREALLGVALAGMKLLEMDSLGGSGSRGYGKVRFRNVKVSGEDIQQRFDALDPFRKA